MALTVGTNSYISLEDAELYFERRIDVSAWTEADDATKEAALMNACLLLDSYAWTGTALSSSQALAWPRYGSYYSSKLGGTASYPTSGAPEDVKLAQAELAYHFLNNDGILDDTGKIVDLKVGSIELTTIISASRLPPLVKVFITKFLNSTGLSTSSTPGSRSWWRAN